MRPLSIREAPPRPEGAGGPSTGSAFTDGHSVKQEISKKTANFKMRDFISALY